MSEPSTEHLVDSFFRHESANLVALLTRAFGFGLVEVAEDMVQEAMLEALRSWRINGVPDNPAGWLHRVAKNRIIDAIRRDRYVATDFDHDAPAELNTKITFSDEAIQDSMLRLMFVCCHPGLDRKSQLALSLKMLCGLSNEEIASGLLSSSTAIKKRVTRAKRHLQLNRVSMEFPDETELQSRLETVHEVLYLMFNEGYSTSIGEAPIRYDLCEEAARLCHLLCESELAKPATYGLLALMLFHAARFESRVDISGEAILLEDQDRSTWDQDMIRVAEYWLHRSGAGAEVTRFHLEAVISRTHCVAQSYQATNWEAIVTAYEILQKKFPSPMHLLNQAVAIGCSGDPQRAIEQLEALKRQPKLNAYPLLWCAMANLLEKDQQWEQATTHWQRALDLSENPRHRSFIEQRMTHCSARSDSCSG